MNFLHLRDQPKSCRNGGARMFQPLHICGHELEQVCSSSDNSIILAASWSGFCVCLKTYWMNRTFDI